MKKVGKKPPATALDMTAAKWWFFSASGVPLSPVQVQTSWYFDFPLRPGFVGYLLHPHTRPITEFALRMSGEITGESPVFDAGTDTGGIPPSCRFILWKAGLNTGNEFDRWWSNPQCVVLGVNQFLLQVPFDPSRWSSVYGKMANQDSTTLAAFNAAKAGIGNIGMTFGGGSDFGHGVGLASGTARFQCNEFALV